MKIAIVGAGFAPEEADRLRRAMATFKRNGDIHLFRDKFIAGMVANGYARDFAERCFSQIEGFGTYGFPESHAASFALLVYVSAWIKCFYPEVFACALLEQPADGVLRPGADRPRRPRARRRGAPGRRQSQRLGLHAGSRRITAPSRGGRTALPARQWRAHAGMMRNGWALRLGLRQIKGSPRPMPSGSSRRAARAIPTPQELWRSSGLGRAALERLAEADAFRSVGLDRRRALWALKALGEAPLPLFAKQELREREPSPSVGGRGQGEGGLSGPAPLESPPHPDPLRPGAEREVLQGGVSRMKARPPKRAPRRCCRRCRWASMSSRITRSLGLSLKRHPLAFLRAELAREGLVDRRRPRDPAGRPAARDRRARADPAAPGQRQRRRLHHPRGRDRDRQSDRLAANPRTLPPRRARRHPALLPRPAAARGERHPPRRRPPRRLDPAPQHTARATVIPAADDRRDLVIPSRNFR